MRLKYYARLIKSDALGIVQKIRLGCKGLGLTFLLVNEILLFMSFPDFCFVVMLKEGKIR